MVVTLVSVFLTTLVTVGVEELSEEGLTGVDGLVELSEEGLTGVDGLVAGLGLCNSDGLAGLVELLSVGLCTSDGLAGLVEPLSVGLCNSDGL